MLNDIIDFILYCFKKWVDYFSLEDLVEVKEKKEKKEKRKPFILSRDFDRGVSDFEKGLSIEDNPFVLPMRKHKWIEGWNYASNKKTS